jgi:HlyD family type I secretion membrane fusion protein
MIDTARHIRRNLAAALGVALLLGGTAAGWSACAPLEGAVVASGSVVVESSLRKVQHPTGGIVGTLNVREGQSVEAGQVLMRLDDTVTRANLGIVLNELTAVTARLARLQAERDGGEPMFPAGLQTRANREADIAGVLEGELALLRVRSTVRSGQKQQLGERVKQLKDEIAGLNEQKDALARQLDIAREELKDLGDLHARGLAQRPRITSLQREILGKEGTIGEIKARVAQTQGRIAETELQVLQLDREFVREVAKEIREVETRIVELDERRIAAEDQLRRIDVRAPISGTVHQLAVHTVGGVISASEAIMLVVPAAEALIVEARVNPADIDQLRPDRETRIRLSAFNRRTTPELTGRVLRVAGDLTKDQQTGLAYYLAGIRIDPTELAKLADLKLVPGMPAEVYIKTGERTLGLAQVHDTEQRYAEAEPHFRRAVSILEKAQSPNRLQLGVVLRRLAELNSILKRHDEAEGLYKRALAVLESVRGSGDSHVGWTLDGLAGLYARTERHREAEPLFERAIAVFEKELGPEHLDVAASLSGLANANYRRGRLEETIRLYRRALSIREKALGPDHLDVAHTLILIADTSRPLGRLEEALSLYQRALAIREKRLGPDHLAVAAVMDDVAQLNKDDDTAISLYERALAIRTKALGPSHKDVSKTLETLTTMRVRTAALSRKTTRRYGEAIALYERLLGVTERTLGPDHADVFAVLQDMVRTYDEQRADARFGPDYRLPRNYAEAEPPLKRLLAMAERMHGAGAPEVSKQLERLAWHYENRGLFAESEPLLKRALAIMEKARGPEHRDVADALSRLASHYEMQHRYADARPLHERQIAIYEKAYPEALEGTLAFLSNRLEDQGRYADAEPMMRRLLAMAEKGSDRSMITIRLNNLALLLMATNRQVEAEAILQRALAMAEEVHGAEHQRVATRLNNMAQVLLKTGRLAEAEPLLRRALAINEKVHGPHHPSIATNLSNLTSLLHATNRSSEAEPLMHRALAINERSNGPNHHSVALGLNNLAVLLEQTNRATEAEPLYRRALTINERNWGSEHPDVATNLNNLGRLLRASGRLGEAEALHRRALAIDEKTFGPDHPNVANGLNHLGKSLQAANRPDEAEPLMGRALAIYEKSYGPEHPLVAASLINLAMLRAELGDWADAAGLHRRAAKIATGASSRNRGHLAKAAAARSSDDLRAAARTVYRAGGNSAQARAEGFELAQWALRTGAADALSQMAVRFAKGGGSLADVVRSRQDLVARRETEYERLLAALGWADTKASDALRASIAGFDAQLGAIDRQLAVEFPEYARLADPKPLAIAAVQGLLKDDETLIAFLDVPRIGRLPGETLAWAVTRTEARWMRVPLDTAALAERVARLRCGLDREGNWTWEGQHRRWMGKSDACRALAPDGLAEGAPLPFDVGVAHELYDALLAPFADLTRGKSLLVVPSGPLTSLPFHVLAITSPSPRASPSSARTPGAPGMGRGILGASGERQFVTWLALTKPITVLPSVGSLDALRKLPSSEAREPYLAFGNPLLDGGAPERAALARARQRCASEPAGERRHVAVADRRVSDPAALLRAGIDLAVLREQAALPETADEVCAVARSLGADEADAVWLGARATEANLKSLSRSGKLARYRVLHFATHGVLPSESEAILRSKAEPALILSPPGDGAAAAELEEDNGLLTASEVAQLSLDADWVVLSACNTAAGARSDAEALSGLARAFFYAKARALLVSHWYVNSEAAVELTTGAFAALSVHPGVGRAEALRLSMVNLILDGRPDQAHPEYWAPFVLVGEGAG